MFSQAGLLEYGAGIGCAVWIALRFSSFSIPCRAKAFLASQLLSSRSLARKIRPSPLLCGGYWNPLLFVEGSRFWPSHPSALSEYSTVLFDVMSRVFSQFVHQVRDSPHAGFERTTQRVLEDVCDLPIRNRVACKIDNLVAQARFEEDDFRRESADVVWGSSYVAPSERDLTVDIFVQVYGVVCVGEHGLPQVFRQGGEVASASDISLQQTQERTDGRVFMGGVYAAESALSHITIHNLLI